MCFYGKFAKKVYNIIMLGPMVHNILDYFTLLFKFNDHKTNDTVFCALFNQIKKEN